MELIPVEKISTSNAFRTAKSRHKLKLSTCVNAMPNNPSIRAAAIEATINEQTPKTKMCINDKLSVSSPRINAKIKFTTDALDSFKETLKKERSKKSVQDD